MPKCCSVPKCTSTGRSGERKFFRFPLLNHKNMQLLAVSQTRQDAWIKALNRANFFPHQYKSASVCDLHFESGRSAALTDVNNVDWIPTWNLGHKISIDNVNATQSSATNIDNLNATQSSASRNDEGLGSSAGQRSCDEKFIDQRVCGQTSDENMPKSCAVVRCNSSGRMRDRKFYRFPMLNQSSNRTLTITQIRQDLWVRALNRIDFPPKRYKHANVCDRHFVSGRSAKFTDVENVDWVPSLHLGYGPHVIKTELTEQERLSLSLHLGYAKSEAKTEVTKQERPSSHLGYETFEDKTEPIKQERPSSHLEYETFEVKTEPIKQERPSSHLGYETFEDKTEPIELDRDFNDQFKLNYRQQNDHYSEDGSPGLYTDDIDVLQDANADGLNLDSMGSPNREEDSPINFVCASVDTIGTQTDDAITGMSTDILASYKTKIAHLEAMLWCKNRNVAVKRVERT